MAHFKRTISCSFIAALSLLSSFDVNAQTFQISGKITDVVSDEPLPFVNVYLKGKRIGTTSDYNGNYSFITSTLEDSLAASSMGYEARTKPLKPVRKQTVNFKLERASINLEEIVIKPGENPAHVLLKRIIENKEKNSIHMIQMF